MEYPVFIFVNQPVSQVVRGLLQCKKKLTFDINLVLVDFFVVDFNTLYCSTQTTFQKLVLLDILFPFPSIIIIICVCVC